MRGTKAKKIRKMVYGEGTHRYRKYYTDRNGTIYATGSRSAYQNKKKDYSKGGN